MTKSSNWSRSTTSLERAPRSSGLRERAQPPLRVAREQLREPLDQPINVVATSSSGHGHACPEAGDDQIEVLIREANPVVSHAVYGTIVVRSAHVERVA